MSAAEPLAHIADDEVRLSPRTRVVFLADGDIPSVSLTLDPIRSVLGRFGAEPEVHYEGAFPLVSELLGADLVMMMRLASAGALEYARAIKAGGVPLVYLLDDDFDHLPAGSPLARRYAEMGASGNIGKLAELADEVVVWSAALAEKLGRHARRINRVKAVSNVERLDAWRQEPGPADPVRVGYAGGTTHADDLAMIGKALKKVLEDRPEVEIESIGLKLAFLDGHPRYRHFPGVPDMDAYYRLVASRKWTVGLAPLIDSPFNAAKSDNKFREYAAAGIPSVYSDMVVYNTTIRHGETGLLSANTVADWHGAIELLLDDDQLRRRVREAALEEARSVYGAEAVADPYLRMLKRLIAPYRVLAVGPQRIATFPIDVGAPFRILGARGRARLRTREVDQVTDDDIAWANTVALVRAFEPPALAVLEKAKAAGKATIYSLDDNWFVFPKDGSDLARHIHSEENRVSLISILKDADLTRVSTRFIEDSVRPYARAMIRSPYGFDFSLVDGRPRFRRDGWVKIGYFGTPGRDAQFDFIIDALVEVQRRHDNVVIEFFGFIPQRAGELANVVELPYVDGYETCIQVLAEQQWDIGLAPLIDTPFNRSKLPTKYRDYAATGAAGVYSRMAAYEDVVANNRTGLVVGNTAGAWVEAISRLVDDQGLRESIANAAFDHVRHDLSAEVAAHDWLRSLARARRAAADGEG